MYASPDDVDLAIGGSFESHAPESILGHTFQCIIGRQFINARTGDRFFFERYHPLSGFSKGLLRFSMIILCRKKQVLQLSYELSYICVCIVVFIFFIRFFFFFHRSIG